MQHNAQRKRRGWNTETDFGQLLRLRWVGLPFLSAQTSSPLLPSSPSPTHVKIWELAKDVVVFLSSLRTHFSSTFCHKSDWWWGSWEAEKNFSRKTWGWSKTDLGGKVSDELCHQKPKSKIPRSPCESWHQCHRCWLGRAWKLVEVKTNYCKEVCVQIKCRDLTLPSRYYRIPVDVVEVFAIFEFAKKILWTMELFNVEHFWEETRAFSEKIAHHSKELGIYIGPHQEGILYSIESLFARLTMN